jgi:hypothetical protein
MIIIGISSKSYDKISDRSRKDRKVAIAIGGRPAVTGLWLHITF